MPNTFRSLKPASGSLRVIAGWLGGAICVLASSAALATPAYNPEHLPPDEIGRIGQICTVVLGLPRAAASDYYACTEGLSQSLVNLPAGAPAFAAQMPTPRALYSDASNGEQHRRQQAACAAVGYTPQTRGAAACVADLDSRLFQVEVPTDK
jgi:hypothetical protein